MRYSRNPRTEGFGRCPRLTTRENGRRVSEKRSWHLGFGGNPGIVSRKIFRVFPMKITKVSRVGVLNNFLK